MMAGNVGKPLVAAQKKVGEILRFVRANHRTRGGRNGLGLLQNGLLEKLAWTEEPDGSAAVAVCAFPMRLRLLK
jgi:hypothetical protein